MQFFNDPSFYFNAQKYNENAFCTKYSFFFFALSRSARAKLIVCYTFEIFYCFVFQTIVYFKKQKCVRYNICITKLFFYLVHQLTSDKVKSKKHRLLTVFEQNV